jgi:CheY-like chemotaxis protein
MSLSTAKNPNRRRVLLVEDDAAVRRSLQLLLFSHGYDVRAYPTGDGLARDPEALSADCLVADLLMPQGNAVTLLQELRAAGWSGPALMISGQLTDEWAKKAISSGYVAAYHKPIGDGLLVKRLAELMPAMA